MSNSAAVEKPPQKNWKPSPTPSSWSTLSSRLDEIDRSLFVSQRNHRKIKTQNLSVAMSNSAAVEKPPHKKRKPSPLPSSWSPLSSLPDEMAMSCLARVPRSDQAALSRVSKSYRSLVASPELYRTRSELGCTEKCLYVCLLTPPDPTPRWFILRRDKTVNRLMRIPIPSFRSQPTEASSVVALDWGIYVIGGCREGKPRSSDVFLLDCRTHTWRRAPSMGVARASAAAGVVGGKIYVFGGCCLTRKCSKWAEVFDPKTQTWDSLPPPPDRGIRDTGYIHDSVVVMEQKVYAVDGMDITFYYSPREEKWGRGNAIPRQGNKRDWCVIDKVMYACDEDGNLSWCEPDQLEGEPEGMYWRNVKGLGSLEKSLSSSRLVHFDSKLEALWESRKIRYGTDQNLLDLLPGARLSNSGGNIVVFWDVVVEGDLHIEIWCAEISLERRKGPEIWGNVEWSNAVMTVDPFSERYKVMYSASVTL